MGSHSGKNTCCCCCCCCGTAAACLVLHIRTVAAALLLASYSTSKTRVLVWCGLMCEAEPKMTLLMCFDVPHQSTSKMIFDVLWCRTSKNIKSTSSHINTSKMHVLLFFAVIHECFDVTFWCATDFPAQPYALFYISFHLIKSLCIMLPPSS